jgi:Tfp pilus assembly protein PilO
MRFRLKHLDLICLIFVLTVSISSGYALARKSIKKRGQVKLEAERRKERTETLKEAENTLRAFNRLLNLTRESHQDLSRKIPESAAIGLFLKELNAMISEREVDLISVDPRPATMKNEVTQIPLQMVFKGPFLEIYRLIHDLEKMERAFVIHEVVVTKPLKEEACQAHLTANIFERRRV